MVILCVDAALTRAQEVYFACRINRHFAVYDKLRSRVDPVSNWDYALIVRSKLPH